MTRILTLLLVTQATAEWVEISQQHYRKPIRTLSPFTTPDKVVDFEDTTKPWTYNNRSVTEYNWNKKSARPPSIGNVKRVQHFGGTVKTTERVKLEEDLGLDEDLIDYELRQNYGPTRATIEFHDHDKQKGNIEKVSNLGNIKRVQLNNSPVKSPTISFKGDREKYSNIRLGPHDDDHHTEANEFKNQKNTETFRRIYVNKVKQHHGTDRTTTFPLDQDEDTSFAEEVTTVNTRSKQEYTHHTTTKPTYTTETEDFASYETQRNRFYKITNSQPSEVTEKTVFTTETIHTGEDIVTITNKKLTRPTTEKASKSDVHKNVNHEAGSHKIKVQVLENNENQTNFKLTQHETKTNVNKAQPIQDQQSNNEEEFFKEIKDKKEDALASTRTEKHKVNTLENVMKFMKVVADTITRNSRRSFGGKMQYLHELKDSILANIEERIDATWPDDDSAGARRRSRSAHASPRGHVQFPSSESALMTISFLTFAVFLIKLVLQVIQTYKNKAMIMAPVMVASGRNVFAHHGHQ